MNSHHYFSFPDLELALDLRYSGVPDSYFSQLEGPMAQAFTAMQQLEGGAIANPDENRMVGHYWLRQPELAPTPEISREIRATIKSIEQFAAAVHEGRISGSRGPFEHVIVIGIGGSALGPQFVADALGHPTRDRMKLHFLDNTDPDGMDKLVAGIILDLGVTLAIVISKSGGTRETRNGMLELKHAYAGAGLKFEAHAVAVTQAGSDLDLLSKQEEWIGQFPIWDWVGGRTSQTSAVGLLPAALQGLDVTSFLAGAAKADAVTRKDQIKDNPAALLAMWWHYNTKSCNRRNMVVLPYKDRLCLLSKYLQQLIMESLGKKVTLDGKVVHEGLTVYGNKGSTDQHAYVQQLREGPDDYFLAFLQVLEDRQGRSVEVDPGITSGDYLHGFLLGTRAALAEDGRSLATLTLTHASPGAVGILIALFERAVGFYASLVNINPYHQPGVEAGKRAASKILDLQGKILGYLKAQSGQASTIAQIADHVGAPPDLCFDITLYLSESSTHRVQRLSSYSPTDALFQLRHV